MKGKQYLRKNTRGFLPIVIDIETSGSDPKDHGILEIAAIFPIFTDTGLNYEVFHRHTHLDDGALIDSKASLIHNIPIDHPFRYAISLKQMLLEFNEEIIRQCQRYDLKRGMIVGHNPSFDMSFIDKACVLYDIPIHVHRYTFIDTASIGLVRHHETVLAKLCQKEGLGFSQHEAHSALYDAYMTARLFWSFMGLKLLHNDIML